MRAGPGVGLGLPAQRGDARWAGAAGRLHRSACSISRVEQNDREIARLQNDVRASVDARPALEQLGYRFVARARRTNDAGDYTLAEQTADCLTSRYPDAAAALLLKGHVLHQLHRFAEAEQIARRLVATREFVLDYGLLGDALMDQGRFTEAAAAYQKMIDLKPYYQSYTRAAHLRWLKGDLDGAIELTELAIQAASPRDPDSVAWAYTRLAGFELQRGRFDRADEAIGAALKYQPDYAAALLTRGQLLLAQQRAAEAVAPLQRAAALNPLPEYQSVFADALRLLDRGEEADRSRAHSSLLERSPIHEPSHCFSPRVRFGRPTRLQPSNASCRRAQMHSQSMPWRGR